MAGDPTLTTFSTQLAGGTGLLGRGLAFSIQGVSDAGNVGTTSGSTGCVYSWAPPDVSAMHLSASVPTQTALGGTTSSTFTLDLGRNPTTAVGGAGGQITFELLSGGKVLQTKGPGTANTATFSGISAGVSYSGLAIVTPPRHKEAAAKVGPVSVSTRSNWPALTITSAEVTQSGSDPKAGTLSVTIGGLSSAAANGERFDLTAASQFTCNLNTSMQLTTDGPFDPSTGTIRASVNLLQYFGNCSVTLQLVEDPGSIVGPPVFGGTQSQLVQGNVHMPNLNTGGISPSDFSAAWDDKPDDQGYSTITVKPTGNNGAFVFVLEWGEAISDTVRPCASATAQPPTTIEVAALCVAEKGGDKDAWTVTISYRSVGQATAQSVTVKVTGTPPTYTPPPTSTPTPTPTHS